jgi:UDP-3-O-[3-hydroxymyristoyl] glucosamine N-acyltransferase
VAPLQDADSSRVSFFDNKKYIEQFRTTKAGAVFVRPELAALAPAGTVCLTHKNPYKAYALAAQAFYPPGKPGAGKAPGAVIDSTAIIGADCSIEHGALIGPRVTIGDRCRIGAHAVIREGVEIGADSDIGAHVHISHALIGRKARIHPGAVIGRQGFGFAIDPAGYVAVPQLGRVIIGDDVEIGANTTVDRGAGPDTEIGQGTRIDNLVQIGHNVKIGRYCVIVAQTGISGSSQLGDYVMTGGQSGIAGHLSIGAGAKLGAQSGIMRDIEPGEEVLGSPALPIRQFMRQFALLARLAAKKRNEA